MNPILVSALVSAALFGAVVLGKLLGPPFGGLIRISSQPMVRALSQNAHQGP
jgi:hypothetical protein